MSSLQIKLEDYLREKHQRNVSHTIVGVCRRCGAEVQWRKSRLITHKVNKCALRIGEVEYWKALYPKKTELHDSQDSVNSTENTSTTAADVPPSNIQLAVCTPAD
jgi:hypothetical protein